MAPPCRVPQVKTTQGPGSGLTGISAREASGQPRGMIRRVRVGPTGRGDHSPCEREETARALAGSAPPPGGPAPNSRTLWTPEDLALVVSGGLKSFILCSFPSEGLCPVAQQRSVRRSVFKPDEKPGRDPRLRARKRRQSPGVGLRRISYRYWNWPQPGPHTLFQTAADLTVLQSL